MLLRTLPAEARLARRPGDETVWTMETELLARLVDMVSIQAAERRLKKPVQTPRPASVGGGQKSGFQALLVAAAAKGRIRTAR